MDENDSLSRRQFVAGAAAAVGGAFLGQTGRAESPQPTMHEHRCAEKGLQGGRYRSR